MASSEPAPPAVDPVATPAAIAWGPPLAVFVAATLWFAAGLAAETPFVDESAYYSQSYFAGLFVRGERDDVLWLDYPAYDLPPLPKYLIGAALSLGGVRTPGPADARAWYGNTALRFDVGNGLTLARWPSVLVGALGCVAVYALGARLRGRWAGLLAAALLAINPLYRLHARRAMSDVPCEAFLLLGLAFALAAWRRAWTGGGAAAQAGAAVAAGLCFGLSLSSKFSGALGPMVAAAWGVLALLAAPNVRRAAAFGGAGLIMAATTATVFVGLNPFLTARPGRVPPAAEAIAARSTWDRVVLMYRLRRDVSEGQQAMFAHNALRTPAEKVATTAVQGFGRFGPFGPAHSDSTIRFDAAQDRGAWLWLPAVVLCAAWASVSGRREFRAGQPPVAWAILTQFAVSVAVVTVYVPMAWDRYFLAIQAPAALLVAGAGAAALQALAGRVRGAAR